MDMCFSFHYNSVLTEFNFITRKKVTMLYNCGLKFASLMLVTGRVPRITNFQQITVENKIGLIYRYIVSSNNYLHIFIFPFYKKKIE